MLDIVASAKQEREGTSMPPTSEQAARNVPGPQGTESDTPAQECIDVEGSAQSDGREATADAQESQQPSSSEAEVEVAHVDESNGPETAEVLSAAAAAEEQVVTSADEADATVTRDENETSEVVDDALDEAGEAGAREPSTTLTAVAPGPAATEQNQGDGAAVGEQKHGVDGPEIADMQKLFIVRNFLEQEISACLAALSVCTMLLQLGAIDPSLLARLRTHGVLVWGDWCIEACARFVMW